MHLSEGAQKQFEEIVQSIQRDLNKLSDPTSDRTTKRRSLDRIQKELSKSLQINDRSKKDEDNKLVEAVLEVVLKPMLKLLGDSVEKCREGALEVLRSFTPRISSPQPFLPYIIPVLVSRLTPVEIVEPSEEIRLSLIEYLFDLIVLSGKDVALFVDDVVAIVDRILTDGFQDVRKIACRIVIETAKLAPQRFALHSAAVLKALSPSLGHRHSAVRIITLQAISQSLKADCSAFTDTYPAIKKLLLDKSNQVRQTLYTMATDLLVNLIDRHVYGFQLVPILLAGMSDEITELRDLSKNGIVQAGERYVLDNEKNVKDEQDWQEVLGVDRPPLGTRKLVQSNISKIVNLILEDLQDWNLETRIKSVQMLRHCVHYGEGHITGFLVAILNGFAKVVNGEPELLQEVCFLLGIYSVLQSTFHMLFRRLLSWIASDFLMIFLSS
ncbi:armadillo-type protein [Paraphysoderma sedebokerense]|nr:armadillo-type protein [Paraphysoderma sedebokerense]